MYIVSVYTYSNIMPEYMRSGSVNLYMWVYIFIYIGVLIRLHVSKLLQALARIKDKFGGVTLKSLAFQLRLVHPQDSLLCWGAPEVLFSTGTLVGLKMKEPMWRGADPKGPFCFLCQQCRSCTPVLWI